MRVLVSGMKILLAVGGLVLTIPGMAGAQTADFSSIKLKTGDTVYVTQSTGDRTQGRVTSISPWQLELANGMMLGPVDVVHIERRGDSLKNGVLIGGLLTGAWCAAVCGEGTSSDDALVGAVVVTGGVGALLGALIDHLHVGRTTVYRRTPTLRLSTALTSKERGVSVSLSF